MKKIIGGLLIVTLAIMASESPKELFEAKCSGCHATTMPKDISKIKAPAIMGVMRHVKMKYKNKDEGVKFIVDYVQNPSKDKAVCMPQRIKQFGLMPSLKGVVTKEELEEIAKWLYDNYPPKNFRGMRGMMEQEKKRGCKREKELLENSK